MKEATFLFAIIVSVLLVSGCTSQSFDAAEIAKANEAVKSFLSDYPNAKIVASYVQSANISAECQNPQLQTKDYWKVNIYDEATNLTVNTWVDASTKNTICIIKTGGSKTDNLDKENIEEEIIHYQILDKYSLSENQNDFLRWTYTDLPNKSKIITWWDFGEYIQAYSYAKSVLNFVSKEGCSSIVNINFCTPPFESQEKFINVAKFFFTDNETEAYCIAKKYDATHTIVTVDLLSKSQWWTYFATWDPKGGKDCSLINSDKGYCYVYSTLSLSNTTPVPFKNTIVYTYILNPDNAFAIYQVNDTLVPYFYQNNKLSTVESIFYFTESGIGQIRTIPDAELNGLIWMDPSKQVMVFIPPELANSLFTRMFLFNGAGLERFEFVNSWGGEVKLFSIKPNRTIVC